MEFKEFLSEIVNQIPDYLLQFNIDEVHIEQVTKNNGVSFTGMAICIKGESVSPNIYMEYYYELYCKGFSMEVILNMIKEEYIKAKKRLMEERYDDFNIDDVYNCLFIRLINYEKNKEYLQDCPFIPFFDLAITFRYIAKISDDGIASVFVKNKDMERWKLSIEEMYHIGLRNTLKLFPPKIEKLEDILREMLPERPNIPESSGRVYVLTNDRGINGATYMVCKEIIRDFALEQGKDIYILPSSIHEVILLPREEGMEKTELLEIVKEANEFTVSKQDFLSENVYLFELNSGDIIL